MNIRKINKDVMAVSPVIATLMLVLVSVSAAGVFYVFQADWQENAVEQVSDANIKATLRIAGSTTVYPLTQVSEPYFESEYPLIDLQYQGGGSGAGRIAVGTGLADIGAASSDSTGKLDDFPDFDGNGEKDPGSENMQQFQVATGSVVIIINKANPWRDTLNTTGMTAADLQAIYMTGSNDSYSKIYDRSTVSGTEETFVLKLVGASATSPYQFEDSASTVSLIGVKGNEQMAEEVAKDARAIGFVEYGFSDDNADIVTCPYNQSGDLYGETAASDSGFDDSDYKGNRPCYYITVGEPTGLVKLWIDWITFPDNNIDMCELSGLYSIY